MGAALAEPASHRRDIHFHAVGYVETVCVPDRHAGDVAEEVAKLKKQSGQNLLIYGSGALVNALMPRNLIDVYRLMVYPLVLGSGERFFRDGGGRTTLALSDAKTTTTGVAVLTYVLAARHAKGAR